MSDPEARPTFLRHLLPWVGMVVALGPAVIGAACSGPSLAEGEADVTSVENTEVKTQAIGNCWLYATAGWAESLHKGATGRDVDLSEAYWNYWFWYEQITGGEVTRDQPIADKVVTGGWWGIGAELIQKYGWANEADFIPESDAKARRHKDALAAIQDSLASGALALPAARRDPTIVRAELNAAWKLEAPIIEEMEKLFPIAAPLPGTDADAGAALPDPPAALESLTARVAGGEALESTRVHAPQQLPVLGTNGADVVTLADVVGVRAENTAARAGKRTGTEAWSELDYTWTKADLPRRRALLKNVQDVLNRRLAVPLAWVVSSNVKAGVYRGKGVTADTLRGLHESVLVDYEVENVPGFGTLRVDVRETRPEALEASLDDAATLTFFRIKNSWGVDPVWTDEEMRQYGLRRNARGAAPTKPNYLPDNPGFNDLFVDYLDVSTTKAFKVGGHVAVRIALPPRLRFPIPEMSQVDGSAPDAGADSGP